MPNTSDCLSDAAKSVVQKTLTRLKDDLSPSQLAALEGFALNGTFFDVEALGAFADQPTLSSEAAHGN